MRSGIVGIEDRHRIHCIQSVQTLVYYVVIPHYSNGEIRGYRGYRGGSSESLYTKCTMIILPKSLFYIDKQRNFENNGTRHPEISL